MVGIARLVYSILLTNENETNDRDPITGSEDRIIGADDSRVIGYFFFSIRSSERDVSLFEQSRENYTDV